MDINLEGLNLAIDGDQGRVPRWFSGLTKFSYSVCSTRNIESPNSEHFVITLPNIDGGLAAVSLGALAAEIERIETNSNFEEINIGQLKVGMRVSIDSGVAGKQKVMGQVKTLSLDDKAPKIEIGSKWIAAKFIQKICLIPPEAGSPQIFERRTSETNEFKHVLQYLSSASLPIHRALLDIRSTTKIIEDELSWEFSNPINSVPTHAKDFIRPISKERAGSGWSLVLNSSESEELAWQNLRSELKASELDSAISILCSGSAILAQIEEVNSKIVFSILGRDDRLLAATELAIKQQYEYSNPMSRDIDTKDIARGIELLTFEVSTHV